MIKGFRLAPNTSELDHVLQLIHAAIDYTHWNFSYRLIYLLTVQDALCKSVHFIYSLYRINYKPI